MSIGSAMQRAKALLLTRKQAYNRTFEGVYAIRVLEDLAMFCRANSAPYVPGDANASHVLIGRQEVWHRINQHLNLSPDELYDLYK